MDRSIEVTVRARDECGRPSHATPLETLHAALELLRRALDAPGIAAAVPDGSLDGESAARCVTSGVTLLVAGYHALDAEAKAVVAYYASLPASAARK